MGIDIRKTPNNLECIRCGDCKAACPQHAVCSGFGRKPEHKEAEEEPASTNINP